MTGASVAFTTSPPSTHTMYAECPRKATHEFKGALTRLFDALKEKNEFLDSAKNEQYSIS